MTRKVIVLGAGGHAKVVLEILALGQDYEIVGILDREVTETSVVQDVPVIGTDELLPELRAQGVDHFFVAVGSVGTFSPRRKLYELAEAQDMKAVTAIHPRSTISPSATIGVGTVVMAGAVINAGAVVGANVIINTGAIVEHDCVVGDHSHISTGARLCGGVHVGAESHVGAGATVRQNLTIGTRAVVGAGAVVVSEVRRGATVIGVPARETTARVESVDG